MIKARNRFGIVVEHIRLRVEHYVKRPQPVSRQAQCREAAASFAAASTVLVGSVSVIWASSSLYRPARLFHSFTIR